MFKYLILLSIILTTACGSKPSYVDDRLRPYFDEFKHQAPGKGWFPAGYQVVIGQPTTTPPAGYTNALVLGDCDFQSPWTITILADFWNEPTTKDDWKRDVVFHELTHCALGYHQHSTDKNSYFYFAGALVDEPVLFSQLKEYL